MSMPNQTAAGPTPSQGTEIVVAGSVDELLAGASQREPMVAGAGKSGALLERVVIVGESYVVKQLDLTDDWTMRAAGDFRGVAFTAWRRGLLARLPECINQPIVGVAEAEAAIGSTHLVPRLVGQGWSLLADVAPRAAAVVALLSLDPGPLVEALEQTPQTFVHGNWRAGQPWHRRRWAHHSARLGVDRPGRGAQRPRVVSRDQLPPDSADEGSRCRGVPHLAGSPRRGYRAVVGHSARAVPARRNRAVRLGEGAGRLQRRARLVGGEGARGRTVARMTHSELQSKYARSGPASAREAKSIEVITNAVFSGTTHLKSPRSAFER